MVDGGRLGRTSARATARRRWIRLAGAMIGLGLGLVVAGCTASEDDGDVAAPSSVPDPASDPAEPDRAADGSDPSPADGAGPPVQLRSGFDEDPGPAWSGTMTRSAVGEPVLAPAADGRIQLLLDDLAPHDTITLGFDLVVIGDWIGGDGGDGRWRMVVDGYQLLDTTFSNGDALQAFPDDLDATTFNPAGEGASNSVAAEFDAVATTYRIERSFRHRGQELSVELIGTGLPEGGGARWVIDDVILTGTAADGDAVATELSLSVADGGLTLDGQVPTERDRTRLERMFASGFPDGVDGAGVTVLGPEASPLPLWFHDLDGLTSWLATFDEVTLEVVGDAATVTGEVTSRRWQQALTARVEEVLGPLVAVQADLGLRLDPVAVETIEGLRFGFATGSAEPDGEAEADLDDLADLLAGDERIGVWITGHTDTEGDEEDNRLLSEARAAAILDGLVARGVDPDRLEVRGRGESELAVVELSDADRAQNRRVTLTVAPG